jgi:hypothetical protein
MTAGALYVLLLVLNSRVQLESVERMTYRECRWHADGITSIVFEDGREIAVNRATCEPAGDQA